MLSSMLFYLIPIFVGTLVVLQSTLNRSLGAQIGLSTAVTINAAVFLGASFVFWIMTRTFPDFFPSMMPPKTSFSHIDWKWHYIIPGMSGFLLVLGLPWAIQQIGASRAITLLVSTQVVVGLLWEIFITHTPVSWIRIFGAVLVILGSYLIL